MANAQDPLFPLSPVQTAQATHGTPTPRFRIKGLMVALAGSSLLGSGLAMPLHGGGSGGPLPSGWDLAPSPQENWIPESVNLVGGDQFVWASAGGQNPQRMLLRTHTEGTAWMDRFENLRASSAETRRTCGGARPDRLFALDGDTQTGTLTLNTYDPWTQASGAAWAPLWSRSFASLGAGSTPPAMFVACDQSGDRVFAAAALPTGVRVMSWDAQAGGLQFSTDVSGFGLNAMEVSADGSTVALSAGIRLIVLDGQGQTLHQQTLSHSLADLSLSQDGEVLVAATMGGTRLWNRDAQGYLESDWFPTHAGSTFDSLSAQVDLSADGTTLAIAHWRFLGSPSTAFEIWNTDTHQRQWQRLRTPLPNRQDLPTQVHMTSDGSHVAFTAWGDDVLPEVTWAVWNQGWSAHDLDLSGSASDLEWAQDGSHFVVGHKEGHAQVFGSRGHVRLERIASPELTWTSPVRPGMPLTLRADRQDAWFTLFLMGPAADPSTVAGVPGSLLLSRSQLTVWAAANDSDGHAEMQWMVPAGWTGPSLPVAVQAAYRTPAGTILGDTLLQPWLLP